MENSVKGFKDYCPICKKHHIYVLLPCPSCGTYATLQPKSEKVCKASLNRYECDGCQAYRDHLR